MKRKMKPRAGGGGRGRVTIDSSSVVVVVVAYSSPFDASPSRCSELVSKQEVVFCTIVLKKKKNMKIQEAERDPM